jgi:hypothetical protein
MIGHDSLSWARACAVLGRRLQVSSSNRCSEVTVATATGRPVRIDTLYCIRCSKPSNYDNYLRLRTLEFGRLRDAIKAIQ